MVKKIAILGFGVEGKETAKYFLGKKNFKLTVFDKIPADTLRSGEWEKAAIKWICGENYLSSGLKDFDLIFRTPGFYRFHSVLLDAEKHGVKISSATILFFENCKTPIIGVTGTKGKGTTARMINLALKSSGFKTILAGNIGEPMLSLIDKVDRADWVVLELSSFQTIDLPKSPKVVVVTNITTDHLDWHKNRKEYVSAKENLWVHQKKNDFIVLNTDDPTSVNLSRKTKSRVFLYSTRKRLEKGVFVGSAGNVVAALRGKQKIVGKISDLSLPGVHNWSNAAAALLASILAGADPKKAWKGIGSFSGVEHRLEKVAKINGVVYINDSAATHPESAIAAIKTFPWPKILILGGSSKGAKFDRLAEEIVKRDVRATLLLGITADDIETELKRVKYKGKIMKGFFDMETVVAKTAKIVKAGDVVLLSPACASFGMFKDYKDRGDQFKKAVSLLKKERWKE